MADVIPIVALDFPSAKAALELVDRLGSRCSWYKVGNELFTTAGPSVVEALRQRGRSVFLDLKFHDIPNTVAGAVKAGAAMGARLMTVHASGGSAMLRAAVEAAGNQDKVGILGVTILTSLSASDVSEAWGRDSVDPLRDVVRLAALVRAAGAQGIVCSGVEAAAVNERFPNLKLLIPGVRLAGDSPQDQARVVTPRDAVSVGAAYIVLGRSITKAVDPVQALERVQNEITVAPSPGG